LQGFYLFHSKIKLLLIAQPTRNPKYERRRSAFFHGINGRVGIILLPPLTTEQVSRIAQGEEFDPEHLDDIQLKATSRRA
jgi:hypothetical protein